MTKSLTYLFWRGSLRAVRLAPDGKPEIVFCLYVRAQQITEQQWNTGLLESRDSITFSGFRCRKCDTEVIEFSPSPHPGTLGQFCRCTGVLHYSDSKACDSSQWTDWQTELERERENPLPDIPTQIDRLTGEVLPLANEPGKEWLRRRLGIPAEVKISDDCQSFHTGNLTVDLAEGLCALNVSDDDPDAVLQMAQTIGGLLKERPEFSRPKSFVMLGYDDFYFWPPGFGDWGASNLPFRCRHCGKRVKWQPVYGAWFVVCFCMYAMLGRGVPLPESAEQWLELRLEGKTRTTKTQARHASGKS
jgi:hypothetical protein